MEYEKEVKKESSEEEKQVAEKPEEAKTTETTETAETKVEEEKKEEKKEERIPQEPKEPEEPKEPKAKPEPEKPKEPIDAGKRFAAFYERWHKLFVIIPLIIFVLSLAFLGSKYVQGEELIKKDVSLTGGISLTIHSGEVSSAELESKLDAKFADVTIRRLSEVGTGKQIGVIIETRSTDIDVFRAEVESEIGFELTEENSSMEFTGPLLGKSFFRQLQKAFIFSFIFIAIVVLIIFRVFVPSFIAVFSILSDAIITLAILSIFNFSLSSAGIAAFLMLIGYSIDTDILLTTRVLKRKEKEFFVRLREAAQTGLTMTFASIIAVVISYFLLISPILKEIFLILSIGLFVDLMNTWLLNASVLKIYLDRKQRRGQENA